MGFQACQANRGKVVRTCSFWRCSGVFFNARRPFHCGGGAQPSAFLLPSALWCTASTLTKSGHFTAEAERSRQHGSRQHCVEYACCRSIDSSTASTAQHSTSKSPVPAQSSTPSTCRSVTCQRNICVAYNMHAASGLFSRSMELLAVAPSMLNHLLILF